MNKQILKNIFFNGIGFITNIVIMLMLTPYLVNSLGVIGYGFIPLAAIFTSYIGIVTESLTISINQNLTKAYHNKNEQGVKEVYNTAIISVLIIIIIFSLLLIYPIIHLDEIISIPLELDREVKLLFLMLIGSFLLSLITAVNSVAMYANNRVDLMQVNNLIRNIFRALFIAFLFHINDKNLVSVGVATLIGNIFSFLYSWFYKNKLISYMNFSYKFFNKAKVKNISNMGLWLLINQLGFVLFMKVDLLIINKMLGADQAGYYSIATQFNDVLRTFAGIISGVLGPAILILYSQNKLNNMINMTSSFIKFLSISISIPIVIICVWSEDILKYWMGDEYIFLSPLIWVLTLPLIINIGIQPLFSIQVAMNKIKIPALMNVLFGAAGVVLSIGLLNYTDLGLYSVAISGVTMLTIKNAIITPIYTSYILNVSMIGFIKVQVGTVIFSIIAVFILLFTHENLINIDNIYQLIFVLLLSGLLLFLLSFLFYSKSERDYFLNFIKEKL
ncbi:TPA: lipopolysaccharide biosynthesis protein [Photobacterium damselae]